MVLGANQSGKTHWGASEAIAHGLGYYPWKVPGLEAVYTDGLYRLPPREAVPPEAWVRRSDGAPIQVPNKGLILTGLAVQKGIGECIWPKIEDLWGKTIETKRWYGQSATPVKAILPNGSTFLFASSEAAGLSFEALTYHWAWVDEPVPSYCFNGIWRGLLRNFGRVWLTLTPLGANSRWVFIDLLLGDPERPRADVEVVNVTLRDNAEHLEEEAIRAFEEHTGYSDSEYAARVFGKFQFLSDSVFSSFRSDVHVIEDIEIPPHWPRGCVVDPHTRRPWFIAWFAMDDQGRRIFYREWPTQDFHRMRSSDLTIRDYVTLIREREGKEQVIWRIMDPNYGRTPIVHGVGQKELEPTKTLQDELAEYGLEFSVRVNDGLDFGIEAVKTALRYDSKRPIGPDNCPKLLFTENCRNLVLAMQNFSFMPITKETRLHEVLAETFKDPCDAVRYAVVYSCPRPQAPTEYIALKDLEQWNE